MQFIKPTISRVTKFLSWTFMLILVACSQGEEPLDQLSDQQGAFLRVVNVNSYPFDPQNLERDVFEVKLEVEDGEEGDLLSSVHVTVSYTAVGSPDDTITRSLTNIEAALFTMNTTTGKLQYIFRSASGEILSALNLEAESISEGDLLTFSWRINLKDGRSYHMDNTSTPVKNQPHFNSPFEHTIQLECDLVSGYGVGLYDLTVPVGNHCFFFGCIHTFQPGEVEVRIGAHRYQRVFTTKYYESFDIDIVFDLNCGRALVTEYETGLNCGGRSLNFGTISTPLQFDNYDDSVIEFEFVEDVNTSCGLFESVVMRLERI